MDLTPRALRVAVVIEVRAVIEIDSIEGKDRNDLHVAARRGASGDACSNALTAQCVNRKVRSRECGLADFECEELLDEVRHREHGRSHIEGEAVDLASERAPSGAIELLAPVIPAN